MSVAEAEAPPASRIFGEITRDSMASDADLARMVMRIVRDACAKRRGGLTVQQVAEGLRDGKYRLWGVMAKADATLEAVAVTETAPPVLEVKIVGPAIEDFAEFLPMFETIARMARCERVALAGPGFFRRHLPEGWFEREIRYERLVGPS